MSRTFQSRFTVIRTNRISDIHKGITCFTPERGIFSCVVHGVYRGKNKLGTPSDPFCLADGFFYTNPVRNSMSLKDAHVVQVYESLRGKLPKLYSGTFMLECVQKGHGGAGEYRELFTSLIDAFGLLDERPAGEYRDVLNRFLLHYLSALGFLPDFSCCSICGNPIVEDVYLSLPSYDPCCDRCHQRRDLLIEPGMLKFLNRTKNAGIGTMKNIKLDKGGTERLFSVLLGMTEAVLETTLKTLPRDMRSALSAM